MFQQWSPKRLFALFEKEVRTQIATGGKFTPALTASSELWEKFPEHVCWRDIQAVCIERSISFLENLADPDCKVPQPVLQAALGEIDWFLHLPEELKMEAEASRAGTQQEK